MAPINKAAGVFLVRNVKELKRSKPNRVGLYFLAFVN